MKKHFAKILLIIFVLFMSPSLIIGQFITNHTTSVQGDVLTIYVNTHFYSDGAAENSFIDSTWVLRDNGDLTVGFTFGIKDTVASVLGFSTRKDTIVVDSNTLGLHQLALGSYHYIDSFQNPINGQWWVDTVWFISGDTSYFSILSNSTYHLDHQFQLYPNPAKEVVHFTGLNGNEAGVIKIFDQAGRVVHQQNIDADDGAISVSGLRPGVYLLHLKIKDEVIVRQLLVE